MKTLKILKVYFIVWEEHKEMFHLQFKSYKFTVFWVIPSRPYLTGVFLMFFIW